MLIHNYHREAMRGCVRVQHAVRPADYQNVLTVGRCVIEGMPQEATGGILFHVHYRPEPLEFLICIIEGSCYDPEKLVSSVNH